MSTLHVHSIHIDKCLVFIDIFFKETQPWAPHHDNTNVGLIESSWTISLHSHSIKIPHIELWFRGGAPKVVSIVVKQEGKMLYTPDEPHQIQHVADKEIRIVHLMAENAQQCPKQE